MPNRTIYVADADLPIFEKAQKLAGDNLSAAIVHALRIFVEKEEARSSGYKEIIVKVGKGRPYFTKQFRGRPLATRRLSIQNGARLLTLTVYQPRKEDLPCTREIRRTGRTGLAGHGGQSGLKKVMCQSISMSMSIPRIGHTQMIGRTGSSGGMIGLDIMETMNTAWMYSTRWMNSRSISPRSFTRRL